MSQTPQELTPDESSGSDDDAPRRDSELRAVRGPYYSALSEAWSASRARRDHSRPQLDLALRAYARDGRARGVPVHVLLVGLDRLMRGPNGDSTPDAEQLRELAGTTVIRAYYRDG